MTVLDNIKNRIRSEHRDISIIASDSVIFPYTELILTIDNLTLIQQIENSALKNKMVFFVLQRNDKNMIGQIGVLAEIIKVFKTEGSVSILIKGIKKGEISRLNAQTPSLIGNISEILEKRSDTDEAMALRKLIIEQLKQSVSMGKSLDFMILANIVSDISVEEFSYKVSAILDISQEEKQKLLEINDTQRRLDEINKHLTHELKILEIEKNIALKTQEKINKATKDAVLREKLEEIQKELGYGGASNEHEILHKKIEDLAMPDEIKNKALSELSRLQKMGSFNPESSYIRTYLDWLASLPWNIYTETNLDIQEAEKILNQDHYGLDQIKERVLEFLSVLKLKNQKKEIYKGNSTNILCFVGPPGVGKTSIGKSISKALNRKFISSSLGGIRDEAEIRGHRRTYVGAMPGRIIQEIRQAGTSNPVFMMDEIDKISDSFMGNPSAALLEVLDPEQNSHFTDHYLEVPYNLSQVFFITTCNLLDTIPPALRDRLEIIEFPGYSEDEKYHIAKTFLIEKEKELNGINKVNFTEKAIRKIIQEYTREAGVRSLERQIATIFRKLAKEIVTSKVAEENIRIDSDNISKFLGPAKFKPIVAEHHDQIGTSPALAWTQAGGDIVFVEVATMKGDGKLTLTGQLGEVMKESCMAALSYIRSRSKDFGLRENFHQETDIHVHVPEGAVPKDGPSAGVAIVTAMISALTKKPIRKDIGMTGEITLRGEVLDVGGIKQKIIAASRAELNHIFIPLGNEKDLVDIPPEIKRRLKIEAISDINSVLKQAIIGLEITSSNSQ